MTEAAADGRRAPPPHLEHFADYRTQHEAATLGMWVFLCNEVLLFGGIFTTAIILGLTHHEAVAEATSHLKWWIGGINTVVLMTSSLTMSVAIETARRGEAAPARKALLVTAGLGVLFLAIKAVEYFIEYEENLMPFLAGPFEIEDPAARLYMNLYFLATGLHAAHLSIGIGYATLLAWRARDPAFVRNKFSHVEIGGLYWHFIDVVWVMLFATVYLVHR